MSDLAATITTNLTSILALLGTASFMIVVAYASFSFNPFKKLQLKSGTVAKLAVGVVLGLLAIYGTFMGTKLADGTIINVRELAAMIAGAVGGPISGLLAGLMGGIHRYTVGGATALPCTVSTILIGVVSGVVSTKLTGKTYLLKGAALGLALESGAMGLILLLVQPFNTALNIVQQIALPMITANTIGLVLWLYVFNKVRLART
jgi:LytS/YehU family sensor histidine kinase